MHRGFYLLFTMKPGRFYTPNTGNVMDGKAPVPGDTLPAPEAPGKESLPDDGSNAILEARNRDYKRDDKGRFAYDGGKKPHAKTKYAPSRRKNTSKVNLKPEKYAQLSGAFKTMYPKAKPADGILTVSDGKYLYYATAAENGGIHVNGRQKIK